MTKVTPIRLSELNAEINSIIEKAFEARSFWIIADITNHTFRPQKNYHNFELVEKDPNSSAIIAKVAGKAWGNGSTRIKHFERVTGQKFTNNINVLIQVKVTFHTVYGLSLELLEIDTNFTLGVLEQQRQATLERLVSENGFIQKVGDRYITKNNQLQLPLVVQKVAVISSKTSAGGEDFRHTLQNNPFGYRFIIDDYFTVVQGEANAEQFLLKLIEVYQSNEHYDVVVITRGGGAQTDFLIFDDYKIGRAVAKFPIPIITGIGHQKNETITDLMANTQTKTPTKAAEFIIARNKLFEDSLITLQRNILIRSQQLFSMNFQLLTTLNSIVVNKTRNIIINYKDSLVQINRITINTSKAILFNKKNALVNLASQLSSKPKIIVYNRISDIKNTISNLSTFNSMYLKNQRGYLGHYVSIIRMISPENILKKGFALVKVNGKIISNPEKIEIGGDIDVILGDNQLRSTVKQKSKYNGAEFDL